MSKSKFILPFSLSLLSLAVQAENEATTLEEVLVTSHPLSAEGIAQANSVIEGEELHRDVKASLGATVAAQPGVHSASFGNAVGRPVIHGLAGARVRTMEDRIDSLDASVTSQDHATTIEPFIADRIEILKGSSTLIYGSGAIGGVVDVHTGRIPHVVPEKLQGRAEVRYGDNADQTTGALRLDGGSGNFAWHVDAFGRNANEYEIPGNAESRRLHEAEEHDEHEEEGEAESTGTLPGSELETAGGAIGFSWIQDSFFAGLSVSRFDAEYGLPGGHAHAEEEDHEDEDHDEHEEEHEEHAEGTPTLDMEQTRVDFEAGVKQPWQGVKSLNLRAGINDYEHKEIEANGEVATTFKNKAWEARLELSHEAILGWEGVVGLQTGFRDFDVSGEEAFTPSTETEHIAAFILEEQSFGMVDIETGLRIESVEHDPETGPSRDFSTFSSSIGGIVEASDALSFALLLDYSSRAPVSEELYSNGPHLATQSFEIGNADLDEEKALNVSATLNYRTERFTAEATLYSMRFSDFIYKRATGGIEDGLDVYEYRQEDADFVGLDAEVGITLFDRDQQHVELELRYDQVKAELDDGENLPRIPPQRYGVALDGQFGKWHARIAYLRNAEQDDVSPTELPTDAYDDVSVEVSYTMAVNDAELKLFVQGQNLTDDEQRNHSSFIKDRAPAPGRNIEAGIRYRF